MFSGAVGAVFGWHAALLAGAGVGAVVLALLLAGWSRLGIPRARLAEGKKPFSEDVRVLLAAPVVLCFLYFAIYAAGLAGVQSFSVAAMTVQYGAPAALASAALTAYMVGTAAGIFLGGFIATRAARHDVVAAAGLAAAALAILPVAMNQIPVAALPAMLALAGFAIGATGPSRDLIVRASTPAGATGRVYGFVYSGLDFGSLSTPVFYGWLMDHGYPQGVFYSIFALTSLAIFTVLQLPGRTRRPAPT
jgi:predicted MFS family arabinose efflux permease